MSTQLRSQSGKAALFTSLAIVAFALAIPFSMWLARSPTDQTQYDRLGAEIGCTCGTCPLRPIATCGCGFADTMLARLDVEVAAGRTDEQIMTVFAAEYGPSIRIKPEGSGLGLLAWLAPMVLLMVGSVAMAAVISHWRSSHPGSAGPQSTDARIEPGESNAASDGRKSVAESDRYRDLVERELDALDD